MRSSTCIFAFAYPTSLRSRLDLGVRSEEKPDQGNPDCRRTYDLIDVLVISTPALAASVFALWMPAMSHDTLGFVHFELAG